MRSLVAVIFAGVLVLGLMGCGEEEKKGPAGKGGTTCSSCPEGKCVGKDKCTGAKKCEKCPEGKCTCKKACEKCSKSPCACEKAPSAKSGGGCCPGH
jgi:hypothetical protein